MQRIVPNIWFDHTAAEAAEFYASVFPDARVVNTVYYPSEGLPEFQAEMAGQVLTVELEIGGYRMIGINAGSEFTPNPSVSFFVSFDSADAKPLLEEVWAKLSEGGKPLMPLQKYPFSPYYGWVEDKYHVSWQLMMANPGDESRPRITPSIMFGHTVQGRAREAVDYYTSVFSGSVGSIMPYPAEADGVAGEVMYGDFQLLDQWFATMDAADQDFTFDCGVSLAVNCSGQAELDRYWSQLSAVPEAEQCGWCTDKFGFNWQIVPDNMAELMETPGAYEKLMAMGKIQIAAFS